MTLKFAPDPFQIFANFFNSVQFSCFYYRVFTSLLPFPLTIPSALIYTNAEPHGRTLYRCAPPPPQNLNIKVGSPEIGGKVRTPPPPLAIFVKSQICKQIRGSANLRTFVTWWVYMNKVGKGPHTCTQHLMQ